MSTLNDLLNKLGASTEHHLGDEESPPFTEI